MLALMKAQLWSGLRLAVRFCPERLRLAFLEQPLTVPMDFDRIQISAHSSEEYYIRSRSASKEPDTAVWLQAVPHDAVFVDVGANIGAYSLMAARLHPQAKVLAIEPSAPTYASLCQNIWLNQLHDRIVPICTALSGTNGYSGFNYSSWQPGAALHGSGSKGKHYQLSFRLDDLIRFIGFPQPTHLKIDVDGAEQFVLSGAPETLKTIQSLMIEMEENNARCIKDILAESGLVSVSSRPTDATGMYVNYLYARESEPESANTL